MTIGELIERLHAIVGDDPRHVAAPVTFGPDMASVEGGVIGDYNDRAILNLASLSLDKVGGF